jgi:integrase
VPLGTRVARELEQLRQLSVHDADEDLVFGHPCAGEVLDHSQLTRRFKSALRAAGLREFRFNDLRHTFGTRMAGAGAPMRDLQEWMGHRSISTTESYADYEPQRAGAAPSTTPSPESASRPSSQRSVRHQPLMAKPAHRRDPLVVAVIVD